MLHVKADTVCLSSSAACKCQMVDMGKVCLMTCQNDDKMTRVSPKLDTQALWCAVHTMLELGNGLSKSQCSKCMLTQQGSSAQNRTVASQDECTSKKASLLLGSLVSRTVPSKKTTLMSFNVWYVFCDTPQHMPEELLDTMPPTIQLSMEDGSGPILYWMG